MFVGFARLCGQGDDQNAVDERGYTPLHDAADKGNTRIVNRLLQGEEVRLVSIYISKAVQRNIISAFVESYTALTTSHLSSLFGVTDYLC